MQLATCNTLATTCKCCSVGTFNLPPQRSSELVPHWAADPPVAPQHQNPTGNTSTNTGDRHGRNWENEKKQNGFRKTKVGNDIICSALCFNSLADRPRTLYNKLFTTRPKKILRPMLQGLSLASMVIKSNETGMQGHQSTSSETAWLQPMTMVTYSSTR